MVQLIHEVAHLLLERGNFTITFRQLLLLALQIERLLVNHAVQLLDLIECFGDFEL